MSKALDRARKGIEIADLAYNAVTNDMARLRELLEAERFKLSKARRMQMDARTALAKAEKAERANRIRREKGEAVAILIELGIIATPITLEGRKLFELNPATPAESKAVWAILEIVGENYTHSLVDPEELLMTAEACREAATTIANKGA